MIFTYKMATEAIGALAISSKQLGKLSNQLASAVIVIDPVNTKLSIFYQGSKSVCRFDYDITDYIEVKKDANPKNIIYYAIKIDTYMNIMSKIAATKEQAEFQVDTESNKITMKAGKSRYSSTCYDSSALDVKAVEDIIDTIAGISKGTEFTKNTCVLKLTPEVVNFYETIIGSMDLYAKGNAIAIEGKKLKYADNLSIIEYTALTDISTTGQIEYLHTNIYDMAKIALTKLPEVEVTYSNSRQYVHFKNPLISLEAVIGVPEVAFRYPDDADLVGFGPAVDKNVVLTINRDTLKNALKDIDGVFDNLNWKLKQMKFKLNAADNKLELNWSDYNAEADTTCDLVSITEINHPNKDIMFIIPTIQISKLLNLVSNTDDIKIMCNDIATTEENGCGILVNAANYKAILAKLAE